MNIKQMTAEIKEQMPEDLNELETLRYIYIYLGKNKSFDPHYYFGNEATKKIIYRVTLRNLNNEEFLTNNKNLICTSISSILKKLAKEFDIDIELMKENEGNGVHMYNIANLKDGRKIHMDLQQDLKFIHCGEETQSFGDAWDFYDKLDKDIIKLIDEKIGYKDKDKGYKKEEIKVIGDKLREKSEIEKVRALFNSEEFNSVLKGAEGYLELENFVEDSLVSIGAYNSDVITCYRDKNIHNEPLPERQYSICVLARERKGLELFFEIYMFKQKEKKFVEVSSETMKKLKAQGLQIKSNNESAYIANILNNILNSEIEK